MREEDFSIRARGARADDPLGEVLLEVNALADTLREQRLGALEATALLSKVMAEIDVAVFAFDERGELQLVNRFGETPARPAGAAAARPPRRGARPRGVPRGGRPADPRSRVPRQVGALGDPDERVPPGRRAPPAARAGRREPAAARGGAPGLAAPDPGARPRAQQLARADPVDRRQPAERSRARASRPRTGATTCGTGSRVIASRAEALSRFTTAYAKLARLPPPSLAPVDVGALLRRVASLETRLPVGVIPGPAVTVRPTPTSSSSCSSTSCATPRTPRSRRGGGVAARLEARGRVARDLGRRRRAGPADDDEPLRAVLHDQAGRLGHRPRAVAADRRSPRRQPLSREPPRPPRLDRAPPPAPLTGGLTP